MTVKELIACVVSALAFISKLATEWGDRPKKAPKPRKVPEPKPRQVMPPWPHFQDMLADKSEPKPKILGNGTLNELSDQRRRIKPSFNLKSQLGSPSTTS